MNCKAARSLIPAYVDAELDPRRAGAVSDHLASCDACGNELAILKRAMDAMGAWEDIEATFTIAGVRERAAVRRPWLLWRMPRLVTAVLALAALGIGSISGAFYGTHIGGGRRAHQVASVRKVSNSLGLDAFDDGLSGIMYTQRARSRTGSEVTR